MRRPPRLLGVLFVIVVVAAACSSTADDAVSSGSVDAGSSDGSDDATSADGADAQPSDGEVFSPTETDRPFDLSGGATTSDEGVTVDAANATARSSAVVNASESWETDWARATIDTATLAVGIPRPDPRDVVGGGVIDVPKFESVAAATQWLEPVEPGALVQLDGEARFYPLSILTRHEVVNDRFGDVPVAVTYCPLCNTALSFDRRVDGEVLRFGTSGLLRNSDLVMWDDVTESLWQQVTGEGIVGELAGTDLVPVSTAIVSFGQFAADFGDGLSLSRDTGVGSNYGANPYQGYSQRASPIGGFIDVDTIDPRFPALERVVGVDLDTGEAKAYPFSVITVEQVVNDTLGDTPVAVFWGGDTADALSAGAVADGDQIGTGIAFDRRLGDRVLTFTPNGDGTFTDDQTGSVWTLTGLAVSGDLEGQRLVTVTHRNEFWFTWDAFFGDAEVYEAS
ncbi:MAG: DUF3179 domain-containing protein [Acidimicrobiales bacterium]